jgi:hypothetical protein
LKQEENAIPTMIAKEVSLEMDLCFVSIANAYNKETQVRSSALTGVKIFQF